MFFGTNQYTLFWNALPFAVGKDFRNQLLVAAMFGSTELASEPIRNHAVKQKLSKN